MQMDKLTSLCQVRNSRRVWLFWDGQVLCGFCILCRRVWKKKCIQFSLKIRQRRTFYIVQIKTFQTGTKKRGSVVLVVVLLLLLPPVLVELMDFNGHIPQLCQIKSLKNNHYCYFSTKKKCNKVHAQAELKPINIKKKKNMLTLKTSLKPPLPSKCNSRYRSFSVGWSLNLRDKMVSSWWAIRLCFWWKAQQGTCIMYTAVGWCVLRVVFIVDSLQFPNVQVSDALQVLKFCLDLCFLLQESSINP